MLVVLRRGPQRVRCYSTAGPARSCQPPSIISPLPPLTEWKTLFRPSGYANRKVHVCLSNPQTAQLVAESLYPRKQTPSSQGKVVIEVFPGPGVLTRALLELPSDRIRKLIVMESDPDYYAHIKALETSDHRIKVYNLNGLSWDSYNQIENNDLLQDVEITDWQDTSDLDFVCHIPQSVHGEQFTAQLLRHIPERSWLFKYGRTRMNMIMGESLYGRINAGKKNRARCKLSVIAEATSEWSTPMRSQDLSPYEKHFWPLPSATKNYLPASRRPGHPMVLTSFLPLTEQVIKPTMLDKWDYCLRRLFVLKTSELRKALPSLAPGADNMIQFLKGENVAPEDELDTRTTISNLSVADWAKVVRAFDKWPFAPENLYIYQSGPEKRM